MTDHFAVLRQPRRPWLDPDQLKEQYQQLAFALHPDRPNVENTAGVDFAAVTEAYRVLSNPRLRVNHLLTLYPGAPPNDAKTSVVPADLAQIFMQAATVMGEIDAHLRKRTSAGSALGRSLVQIEGGGLQKRADLLLKQLESANEETELNLRALDEKWRDKADASDVSQLQAVSLRLAYLDRWTTQLREKQFQLSN
jgi:curved DNA-binding protein CbpA